MSEVCEFVSLSSLSQKTNTHSKLTMETLKKDVSMFKRNNKDI